MTTLRRGTKIHKAVLNSATGCVVYSEHNQYQGKKCSPEAAITALEKFSFAKLLEHDGRYTVRVHDRCWFELEHGATKPSTEEQYPTQKIRKSCTGKLHLSGGLSAANCSSGNRGMRLEGRVPAKAAGSFPRDYFCKKCFGTDPYATVARMVKAGYLD